MVPLSRVGSARRDTARIHEAPVDWLDDPGSRVDVLATALADLKGIARIRSAPKTNHHLEGSAS